MSDVKKASSRSLLPTILASAVKAKPEDRELFLCEGDSAFGSCKQARDSTFQEVMKLKGKTVNSMRESIEKVLGNEVIQHTIIALGIDTDHTKKGGKQFSADGLRTQNVYLLADADSDGMHINLLMLSFFYKFIPDLIRQKRVHVVDAPLFHSFYKNKRYIGSTFEACYKQMPKGSPKQLVIRLKGWGESVSIHTHLLTNYGQISYYEMCKLGLSDIGVGIHQSHVKFCSTENLRRAESIKVSRRSKGIFKITTKSGYEIILTDEHVTPVLSNGLYVEKKTTAIICGDSIIAPRGQMVFGSKEVDLDVAAIVGSAIACGTFRKTNLFISDDYKASIHQELFVNYENLNIAYRENLRDGVTTNVSCVTVRDKELFDLMRQLGYKDTWNSHTKRVPIGIRMGDYDTVCAFLHSYLNRDGSLDKGGARFEVNSVSKKLLYDIKLMLANLGIIATLTVRGNGSFKPNTSIWKITLFWHYKFITLCRPYRKCRTPLSSTNW